MVRFFALLHSRCVHRRGWRTEEGKKRTASFLPFPPLPLYRSRCLSACSTRCTSSLRWLPSRETSRPPLRPSLATALWQWRQGFGRSTSTTELPMGLNPWAPQTLSPAVSVANIRPRPIQSRPVNSMPSCRASDMQASESTPCPFPDGFRWRVFVFYTAPYRTCSPVRLFCLLGLPLGSFGPTTVSSGQWSTVTVTLSSPTPMDYLETASTEILVRYIVLLFSMCILGRRCW